MTESQEKLFLDAIRSGATMAEAARRAGVLENSARVLFARGEKTGLRTVSHAFRERVLSAQADFEQTIQGIYKTQADKGIPKALDLLDTRAREQAADLKPKETPPTEPLKLARWLLALVLVRIPSADGIAFNNLVNARASLTREIADLETKAKNAAKEAQGLRALKNADSIARLRTRLKKLDYGALLDLLAAAKAEAEEQGLST